MKIRLVNLDDWQGLYINNRLVMENHSLDIYDVIEKILPEADFKSVWLDELDGGRCPENWTEDFEEQAG
jgi:hypothetical protein